MEAKPKPANPLTAVARSKNPLMLIIGAAVVLLLVLGLAAILITSFKGGKSSETGNITGVIHEQQEIIRVNSLAADKVQSTDLVNFVATTGVSMTSSQQKFEDYASSHGVKINAKELAKYVGDSQNDAALSAAEAASTYDTTFAHIMSGLLTSYQTDLRKLDAQTTSSDGKSLIEADIQSASLLQTMLNEQ